MADGGQEIEIKLRLSSAANGRERLLKAGFTERHERCLERNTLFDDEQQRLRQRGEIVRLRQYGGKVVLTHKKKGGERAGSVEGSRHKYRPELETEVTHAEALISVLQAAGLSPILRYEKYRTIFAREGERGMALLDETPIGIFLELEGEPDWIDSAAHELGFGVQEYVTSSYLTLHEQLCLQNGRTVTDMLFEEVDAG